VNVFKFLLYAFLAFFAFQSLRVHAQAPEVCLAAYEKAEWEKVAIPGHISDRTVAGVGRLYFHVAPDDRCRLKNVFVVPNDRLEVYAQYGEFTEVIYWNPVSGAGTAGWVPSFRLVETAKVLGMARTNRDF
jgi:hypothetical protein